MDKIYSVNGPVVKVADTKSFAMQEMVYVGKKRLIGEVIRVQSDFTTIQVYEGTTGLMPDEPVISTGAPMSATLGPGIINNIFNRTLNQLSISLTLSKYEKGRTYALPL